MREKAAKATGSPWIAFRAHARELDPNPADWIGVTRDLAVDYDADVFATQKCLAEDAEHIASWHPAVALTVADLLDRIAEHVESHDCEAHCQPSGCPEATAADAVARAYLGADT